MNHAVLTVVPPLEVEETLPKYLDLLARVKKALETGREISILFSDIRPYPTQPREYFNAGSIRRLSATIDAGGQTSSGMVREKPADIQYEIIDIGTAVEPRQVVGHTRYELIDGERRWRGVGLIPESRRPLYRAKLIVAEDDVVQYLISGITNFNREGHTALETMRTIDRHLAFGFPMKEIANLLGISEGWAGQMHGLKNLKTEYQKLLNPDLPRAKQLPIMAAVQISKIEARLQGGLVERVLKKDVTLGRLRGEVVKVAQKAGSNLRIREIKPDMQWKSFWKKLDVISRTAGDAKSLIDKGEINRFIKSRPQGAIELLEKLQTAKNLISQIESAIRQARS